MAISKQVNVICDVCGDVSDETEYTVAMVRQSTKDNGWTYRNGKDICCYCNGTYEREDA